MLKIIDFPGAILTAGIVIPSLMPLKNATAPRMSLRSIESADRGPQMQNPFWLCFRRDFCLLCRLNCIFRSKDAPLGASFWLPAAYFRICGTTWKYGQKCEEFPNPALEKTRFLYCGIIDVGFTMTYYNYR